VTVPENFVSRWARLKRSADIQRRTESTGDSFSRPPAEVTAGSAEAAIGQPGIDRVADAPFDPASLPSIEAISVNTDIRGFLQSRVPAELTRAALRQVWASDPAIRDFVGIGENQWDFNDPHAIPGFGPLLESDNVPDLLAQALGQHDELAGMVPEVPPSVEQVLPGETRDEPVVLDRKAQRAFDGSPPGAAEDAATSNEPVAEEVGFSRPRSHGSALPR
jgi:Protein of unknown function (DUF3306)